MKKIHAFLFSLLMIVGLGLVAPSSATAVVPYCNINWGSLPKQSAPMSQRHVTDVRAGSHQCYDRLVVDLDAASVHNAGYYASYVSKVRQDGSGKVVPLRGGAYIQFVVRAPAYNDQGQATYNLNRSELVNVSGFHTFRQVAGAGSFEGQTTIGVGVRARLPFRVFTLEGPGNRMRVVLDVARYW
jgi:hypothetical protein